MLRHWIISLVLLFVLPACQSLQKLYDSGQYGKAHRAALKKLEDKPNDGEALAIMEDVLGKLQEQDHLALMRYRDAEAPDAWKKGLKLITQNVDRLAESSHYLQRSFDQEYEQLESLELAFREDLYYHYLAAGKTSLEQALQEDDAAIAYQAYDQLHAAQQYGEPDFAELDQLPEWLETAEEIAVVYYQVEVNDGFNIGLGVDIDGAFSNLEQLSTRFRQIELAFMASSGDCVISIDFGEFESEIEEDVDTREFKTEVIADYETEVDTAGNEIEIPIYEFVYGQVEIVTSRKIGYWQVAVDVTSNTNNCDLFDGAYEERVVSEIELYRTQGDERAIPDEYQDNGRDDEHPDDEEMAEELLEYFYGVICGDYFGG